MGDGATVGKDRTLPSYEMRDGSWRYWDDDTKEFGSGGAVDNEMSE